MPYQAPPELAALSLAEIAEQVAARKLPPVESWSPQNETDSLMKITADGQWFHDGGAITRQAMVRAFSGLLKREEDGPHWLVTPFEKAKIEVEDAAYIAVDVSQKDHGLAFRLNTDDFVIASENNRLIARGNTETPALYLQVRGGLEARLNRSTYQQLADIALASGEDWTVESCGAKFSLLPA